MTPGRIPDCVSDPDGENVVAQLWMKLDHEDEPRWVDYARSTLAKTQQWVATWPTPGEARGVDWLYKDVVVVPPKQVAS